jgi:superfamily II DNA helicase RecQ
MGNGDSKMMACTSAFRVGVDRPNVRYVVIHSPKYNFLSLLQVVGRAGRDGTESHVFFTTTGKAGPSTQSHAEVDMRWQLDQLLCADRCKARQAMEYMDGKTLAKECRQIPNQVLCDVCFPDSEVHKLA